jgi:O-acetylhomoserine (thiol)-lyase
VIIIISSRNLFSHTYFLFTQSLSNYGLETRFADTRDPAEVKRLIDENTRLIFLETVTNPNWKSLIFNDWLASRTV